MNWFMESVAMQAYAIRAFEEDDCEAIVTDTLYYDLTSLKEKYQEFYNEKGSNEISIIESKKRCPAVCIFTGFAPPRLSRAGRWY